VGVNLLNLVSGKVEGAVSACELGYAVSPDALLPVFLSELDARSVMRSNELVEEWKEWQCIIGKMVEVNDGAVYRGIAVDVDMNGFLIVESDGKRRRVVAGDVRIIRTEGAARPDL
jgi:biotin-(acetyl-CoA carboxylase) ligase